MTIKKIILIGDPLLRKKCAKVNNFDSPEVKTIKSGLRSTLQNLQKIHKKGGGLAAPQIGYLKRVIYINAKGRSFFLINPKITYASKRMFNVWDFCFSGNAAFTAQIKRHWKIIVEYDDEKGQKQEEDFKGYFSELLQHEIDHLEGRLFIDLIKDPSKIKMIDHLI
ncbi:MAG: peptide deformylase [Ignavibacteriaceae bacterium]